MLDLITPGAVSMLLVEGVKWLIRYRNPNFEFPTKFYLVAIPVMNILVIPLLALLGLTDYVMPTDWLGFARSALQVLVASLISVGGYNVAFKSLKEKAQNYNNVG
jgi:hypothetical protein